MAAALMQMAATSNAQPVNITATAVAMLKRSKIQHGSHNSIRHNRIGSIRQKLTVPATPGPAAVGIAS
jgi:hypothetical protein